MKNKISFIIISLLLFFSGAVSACELSFEDYKEENIVQSYIVGDYIFNVDKGFSPSLEDFAIAARSIKDDEDVYIYNILYLGGKYSFFSYSEVFSDYESQEISDFPYLDVTFEYRNHIRGASLDDYDIFTCKTNDIKIDFTSMYTEGIYEYKTNAIRYINVESTNDLKELKYCLTSAEACEPDKDYPIHGNPTLMEIEYETNINGQRVCVLATDSMNHTTKTVCDTELVKVDKQETIIRPTNINETIIEGEPHGLDDLFEVEFSVSGGSLYYFYYTEENGVKQKHLLTNLSELPKGDIEVEVMARSGSGIITTASRIIKVRNIKITYDYMTNGGTSVSKEIDELRYKQKVDLTVSASKDGYLFTGWSTEINGEIIKDLTVYENTTLYANFEKIVNANFVVYNIKGATPAIAEYTSASCTIKNNESTCVIKAPKLSAKVGYHVLGWSRTMGSKTAQINGDDELEVNADFTLYSVTRRKNGTTVTLHHLVDGNITVDHLDCYEYNGEDACEIDTTGVRNDRYGALDFSGYSKNENTIDKVVSNVITSGQEWFAYYEDEINLTYISNNKNEIDKVKIYHLVSDNMIKLSTPATTKTPNALDGYTALGWRKDKLNKEQEYEINENILMNSSQTFYAVYEKNITATYVANSSETNVPSPVNIKLIQNVEGTEGSAQLKLDDALHITKIDNLFKNWVIDGRKYDAGETITIKNNINISAEWSLNGTRVIFDYATNGGNAVDKSSVLYLHDTSEPIDLTLIKAYKPGWVFMGWTTLKNNHQNLISSYAPTDESVREVTLYAVYKKDIVVTYRIQDENIFHMVGNEKNVYTIYNNDRSIIATIPSVTILDDDYEFLGWSKNEFSIVSDYNPGDQEVLSESTEYYTISKKKQPLVSSYIYYDGNERKTDNVSCYLYNNAKTCKTESAIQDVSYLGGSFIFWSKDANKIDESKEQIIGENTNFYAVYNRVLALNYVSGYNAVALVTRTPIIRYSVNNTGVNTYGVDITFESPDAIEGLTTMGWRVDNAEAAPTKFVGTTETLIDDLTLYAIYRKDITLGYVEEGGYPKVPSVHKQKYYNTLNSNTNITIDFVASNAIQKEGYAFTGWALNNTNSIINEGANLTLANDAKLFATWNEKLYTVTYDYSSNGGSSSTTETDQVAFSKKADLTVQAYKDGWTFVGWSLEKDSKKILDEYRMPAQNITLYAVYKKEIKAHWSLIDPLAGTLLNPDTSCFKYNNETGCDVETGHAIANEGYTILGWSKTQGSTRIDASNFYYIFIENDSLYYSVTTKNRPLQGLFYYNEGLTIKNVKTTCNLFNGATSCTLDYPVYPRSYKEVAFAGWSRNKDSYIPSTLTISTDTEYYPYYKQVLVFNYYSGYVNNPTLETNTDTVEYILSDGVHSKIPEIITKVPLDITYESNPYTALGWRQDDSKTDSQHTIGKHIITDRSIDFFAVYNRQINISYDKNGGNSTPASESAIQYYNTDSGCTSHTFTLPAAITRSSYTFTDWTENSTTGEKYIASSSITIIKTTVMYAYFFKNPTIGISNGTTYGEWSNGITTTVTFDGKEPSYLVHYVYSTRAATTSVNAYDCGNGSAPGTCSGSATKSISAGRWYKVSGTTNVEYKTNLPSKGDLTVRTYGKRVYDEEGETGLLKVDVSGPSIDYKYEPTTKTEDGTTHDISAKITYSCSDGYSGTSSSGKTVNFSSSGSTSIECVDHVGNKSKREDSVTIWSYSQSSSCSWNECLHGHNTCKAGYKCPTGYNGGGDSKTCWGKVDIGTDPCASKTPDTCQGGYVYGEWTSDGTCDSDYSCRICDESDTCKTGTGVPNNVNGLPAYKYKRSKTYNSCKTGSPSQCVEGPWCPDGWSFSDNNTKCYRSFDGEHSNCLTGENTCVPGYNTCWHTV